MTSLYIQDVTLRDGMHAMRHQYDLGHIRDIATALSEAGVDAIEVSHGDGLGGSTLTYGYGRHTDDAWIEEVAKVCNNTKITTLLLPGIGLLEDLKRAADLGVTSVRVATHCSEADCAIQSIMGAKDLGLDVSGFLMMSHMLGAEKLTEQALLMEQAGADCVYVTDSAGAMLPHTVKAAVSTLRGALKPDTQVGVHMHENLSLSVANSLGGIAAGAFRVDGSLAGQGAGAGNLPLETFIAVANLIGLEHGCDLFKLQDAAEDLVRPLQDRPVRPDRETSTLGYAGVYSSFLRHAERASEVHGVDTRTILEQVGKRKLIGGQEDMILDVVLDLIDAKKTEEAL